MSPLGRMLGSDAFRKARSSGRVVQVTDDEILVDTDTSPSGRAEELSVRSFGHRQRWYLRETGIA